MKNALSRCGAVAGMFSRRFIIISLLVALMAGQVMIFSHEAKGAEPSEEEMRGAVEAFLNNANENLRSLKMQCQNRSLTRNNPVLAMQCLTLFGATFGTGNLAYHLTYFKKIGQCQASTEYQGYICDFVFSQSIGNSMVDNFTKHVRGVGRFVETEDGWILIPLRKN